MGELLEFHMSPKEVKVLFDRISLPATPVGLQLPEVNQMEYEKIAARFASQRLVLGSDERLRMNKTMNRILGPVLDPTYILIMNQGEKGSYTFSTSLYFSPEGATAVREDRKEIYFTRFADCENLLVSIPDLNRLKGAGPHYVSYVQFDMEKVLTAVAEIDTKNKTVSIQEEIKYKNKEDQSIKQEADLYGYNEALKDKLRRLYSIVLGD